MPHRRTEIRDALADALAAAPEIQALAAVPPVEKARAISVDASALPRILVYFGAETPDDELESKSPRVYLVNAELVIEYVSRHKVLDTNFEEDADLAAEAIEPVLDRLETTRFGGLVKQARYSGTEVVADDRGDRIIYAIRIRMRVEYQKVVEPVTDDAFLNVGTIYNVGDAPADHPTDSTDLEQ